LYKKYPISQHLHVTVYPLDAIVSTAQIAQLEIADVHVLQTSLFVFTAEQRVA